jgi:hypothetical protein
MAALAIALKAASDGGGELSIPSEVLARLSQWRWGVYGWTSPANLLITAAWLKVVSPTQDICRIWSRNNQGRIEGSYSIRTYDEQVTVPFVTREDIATAFCSANSGMQGSRALEKSRSAERISRDYNVGQRTIFSQPLFAELMNDIDDGGPEVASAALTWILGKALDIRHDRTKALESITASKSARAKPADLLVIALMEIKDPEFVKCVAAACLSDLLATEDEQLTVLGVDSYRTAADARSGQLGDLLLVEGKPEESSVVGGFEIKDQSRRLDYQNIATASNRLSENETARAFGFVVGSRAMFRSAIVQEELSKPDPFKLRERKLHIALLSVEDLVALCEMKGTLNSVVDAVGVNIGLAKSLKIETPKQWAKLLGIEVS